MTEYRHYAEEMARWEPDARRRFVEAAVELFAENGYEKTGVSEISARAGLTKTTFFRHFRDKREVLFAGQEVHSRLLADAVAAAPAQATPAEMVALAIGALAASFPAERRAFSARLRAIIAANPELEERAAFKRVGYRAAIVSALGERGVSGLDADVAAGLGILAFDTAYAEWSDSADGAELPDYVARALGAVLDSAQRLEARRFSGSR